MGSAQSSRVLLALSGGVDSSVAVHLLRGQGYEVHGLVLRFSPAHDGAVERAQATARELDVPLDVQDCGDLFERQVIEPFCAAYAGGTTPNPCVVCNPGVKFMLLARHADALGIPLLASGHYARVEARDGTPFVAVAKSAARDQSYMLYRLPQSILARLLLPVGEHDKDEIRRMAEQLGLSSAQLPDSQEICFIPDGSHAAYMEGRGFHPLHGRFIGPDGQDLGPHKGVHHYTVGQRKRLGVAVGEPLHVRVILPGGDIQLCRAGESDTTGVRLDQLFITDGRALRPGDRYAIKIRSVAKPAPCRVLESPESGTLDIAFDTPQFAAAPGQHAVLYRDSLVIGGGRIARAAYNCAPL